MYSMPCQVASKSLTSISNSFHLVDIIVVNDVIKCGVQIVEEVHDLVGSAATGQLGKANNIAANTEEPSKMEVETVAVSRILSGPPEENSGTDVALRLQWFSLPQVISYLFGKHTCNDDVLASCKAYTQGSVTTGNFFLLTTRKIIFHVDKVLCPCLYICAFVLLVVCRTVQKPVSPLLLMHQVLSPLCDQHLQVFAVLFHLRERRVMFANSSTAVPVRLNELLSPDVVTRLIIMSTGLTLIGLIR